MPTTMSRLEIVAKTIFMSPGWAANPFVRLPSLNQLRCLTDPGDAPFDPRAASICRRWPQRAYLPTWKRSMLHARLHARSMGPEFPVDFDQAGFGRSDKSVVILWTWCHLNDGGKRGFAAAESIPRRVRIENRPRGITKCLTSRI